MRRKLQILLSLLILAAAAEGVVLCKHKIKHSPDDNDESDESVSDGEMRNYYQRSEMGYDYASDADEYNDHSFRMESLRGAEQRDDMAEMRAGARYSDNLGRYRAENAMNDAAILEALLRAETFRREVSNRGSSDEESRRRAVMNRIMRRGQVRGEGMEENGFRQDRRRRVEEERVTTGPPSSNQTLGDTFLHLM